MYEGKKKEREGGRTARRAREHKFLRIIRKPTLKLSFFLLLSLLMQSHRKFFFSSPFLHIIATNNVWTCTYQVTGPLDSTANAIVRTLPSNPTRKLSSRPRPPFSNGHYTKRIKRDSDLLLSLSLPAPSIPRPSPPPFASKARRPSNVNAQAAKKERSRG